MSHDTEIKIRQRLAEYLSNPAAEFQDVARRYDALPVYSDVGGTLFLTPSSQVLCLQADSVDLQEEHSLEWRLVALVRAAEKFPELQPLLPARPDNAPACAACSGRGSVAGGLRCGVCLGLGWPVRSNAGAQDDARNARLSTGVRTHKETQ
jgi:hypothetical protein